MTRLLEREIDGLKAQMISLSQLVESALYRAVQALEERNTLIAKEVADGDAQVDDLEVELEEECLKILALHQPVAIDLRFVVAILKMNSDLERIADLAVSIARRAADLSRLPPIEPLFRVGDMASLVKGMLRKSLDALVQLSPSLAREVSATDEQVDRINREVYRRVQERLKQVPAETESLLLWFLIARNLERIADHVTNLAEDVIYMVEGEIVRHSVDRF